MAERIDVLVVEREPHASSHERRALEAAGARCWLAADAVSAENVIHAHNVKTLVLGASLSTATARSMAEALARDLELRVVRLSARASTAGELGSICAAALCFVPLPVAGVVAAAGLVAAEEIPAPSAAAAAAVTSLAGGLDDAMREACRALRRAFHADACAVFTSVPSGVWVAGFDGVLSDDDLVEIRERALASAKGRTTVMGSALLTRGESDAEFESWLGARIMADDQRLGVIALSHAGARHYTVEEHVLLGAVAQRFAVELSWRGVHDHMVLELDAMRGAGGLDPLLGVWSEPTLMRLIEMMIAGAKRGGNPLTVAVLDVMDLGGINEKHGHDAGDAVLRHVAERTGYAVRAYDVVGRYRGGIATIFNATGSDDATQVVRRVQRLLGAEDLVVDKKRSVPIETRAGVAAMRHDEESGEALLSRAEAAAREARTVPDRVVSTSVAPTSPSDPPPAESLRGLTLGGMYRLLHQIGSGGGGGVYRGEDLGLGRSLAIKVLNPELAASGTALDRFRQEASILGSLRHPNLVQIYAFGVDAGYAYFVMELVEGESVEAAIERYRRDRASFPLSDVARIVRHVAMALDTLHGSGVVHRDVKPANVLLDPFRDRSVLVDVGIARHSGSEAYVAGTPPYMAPEVFANEDVGPRADVFGLAATAYEMLVLARPWPDIPRLAEMMAVKKAMPPKPLSHHRPELECLDAVLARGLNADHHQRYPSVLQFAQALRAGLKTLAAEPPETEPHRRQLSDQPRPGRSTVRGWQASRDSEEAMTRVVVFRAMARVIGARNLAGWRMKLAPEIAEALSPSSAPLGWSPTAILHDALSADDVPGGRSAEELGRELGRATLRATFRRFFPASPATLSPRSTMTSLKQIWAHYHSWGNIAVVAKSSCSATVTIKRSPKSKPVCALVTGMLEQLILLSGGVDCDVLKLECEARGGECCRFELAWKLAPT